MKRFPYQTENATQFPVLTLTIESPNRHPSTKIILRVDTGADMTVIPSDVLKELNAVEVADVMVADFDTGTSTHKTFSINVRLGKLRFEEVEVISSDGGAALLGLDILNLLDIHLNGPKKVLTVV
ncbi:MAG: retroviral-like aspartic protease family protein [Ignavibacteriae bacterium]|nr:retroviral-like aspartic protease family protein [Ignavibacteriota bacterium]